ncbi:hypothetical protein CWI36_2741p0010 [Hamiltosporidium magnivora]|uniref:Uncharacterized protein n=1 Tax=Hamiltosporidium magnivora TaxID=148818 RepID=A0A4Q9KUQ8_9MICR|nr:hypothetical protein CWI36_2741p0010 [Hamiltosporidium magnivora]
MQNSGLDTLPSPNAPVPSMVMPTRRNGLELFFLQYRQGLKECQEMAGRSFKGTIWKFGCTLDIDAFKKFAQNEAKREIRQEEMESDVESPLVALSHVP